MAETRGRCRHQHLAFNWFYGREEGKNDLHGVLKVEDMRCNDCGAKFRFKGAFLLERKGLGVLLDVREERAT